MDRGWALFLTLLAGALIAAQPPANGLLARHVSSLGAAFVSLALAATFIGVAFVLFGNPADLRGLSHFRPEHLLAPIGGAAVVLVSVLAVGSLGAGGVAASLVATQLIAAALLDRAGLLGLEQQPFTVTRVAGIVLLIAGTILVTSR